jgi:hypothetical protein
MGTQCKCSSISSIKEVQVPDDPVPSLFELDLLTIPASS